MRILYVMHQSRAQSLQNSSYGRSSIDVNKQVRQLVN